MKEKLYCLRFYDKSENTELTEKILMDLGFAFSTWMDIERRSIEHVVYSEELTKALETALDVNRIRTEYKNKIKLTKPVLEVLKKEDWAEAWKKHFKVQKISTRITIKPSWLTYSRKRDNELVIELDPGMSFGTGKHATTKFCIRAIDKIMSKAKVSKSFIDAGCGSGIITAAAVKLGYHPVSAFDNDEEAVQNTRDNLKRNGISRKDAKVFNSGLEEISTDGKYDVVVANIISDVLIANRGMLSSILKKDGSLVLAGILDKEFPKLKKAFIEIGFKEEYSKSEDDWTGAVFRKGKNKS